MTYMAVDLIAEDRVKKDVLQSPISNNCSFVLNTIRIITITHTQPHTELEKWNGGCLTFQLFSNSRWIEQKIESEREQIGRHGHAIRRHRLRRNWRTLAVSIRLFYSISLRVCVCVCVCVVAVAGGSAKKPFQVGGAVVVEEDSTPVTSMARINTRFSV